MAECLCFSPPFEFKNFDERHIGTDDRYGDVSIQTCKTCGSTWLHYYQVHDSFTESGRWYHGLITKDMTRMLKLETAVPILENLEWHFIGGSYFRSTGKKVTGPARIFDI